MFNCIESDALFGLCEGMQLREQWIIDLRAVSHPIDVYILKAGATDRMGAGISECAYRLSDYLLATAPVGVKD